MTDKMLLAVQPDGVHSWVPCTYEGIKTGLNQATMDVVMVPVTNEKRLSLFIDDNGLIEGGQLNIPASMFASRSLYGPVVLADVDEEGETIPVDPMYSGILANFARRWMSVIEAARQTGQDVMIPCGVPDTVPPPQVINMNDEQFDHWLKTGEFPAKA